MSLPVRVIGRVLRFNRAVRILIAGLIALEVTLLLTLMLQAGLGGASGDRPGSTVFYAAAAVGLVVYLAGWSLIVGPSGKLPSSRSAAGWYVLLGVIGFVLTLVVIVVLFSIGSAAI